jgi:hypothetical protein
MSNTEQFWADTRKREMEAVADKWWERLAHIRNGVIGDGVHVVYEWAQGSLIRAYIGHEAIGPCLQYDVCGRHYTGDTWLSSRPVWYNCYSRGNYGKRCAHGGNWSGHNRDLHPRIMAQHLSTTDEPAKDWTPDGSVQMIEVDCSTGWSLTYTTAAHAWSDRLTPIEIQQANLPITTKQHMALRLTPDVIGCIRDVIEAYQL